MCGRYVTPPEAALEHLWRIDRQNWTPLPQRFNVAPTTSVPIVRRTADGAAALCMARWGLIPPWWKDEKPPALTFNARSEEAADKPTWRQSYRHLRCLMPAQGWYEWHGRRERLEGMHPKPHEPKAGEHPEQRDPQEAEHLERHDRHEEHARSEQRERHEGEPAAGAPAAASKSHAASQPYYIYCASSPVIAFAGLLATWQAPEGHTVVSCAMLSKAAAPSIAAIHDRMPVVLPPESYNAWLDPDRPVEEIAQLIARARVDFTGHPVGPEVNNTHHDSPDLIREVAAAL